MDETLWGLMTIVGPIILLALLLWAVMRSRRKPGQTVETTRQTEQGTDKLYDAEEERRRDGTDDR